MTKISIHRSKSSGEIIGICAQGHSGDAKEGESIVCAGVSTVFELLLAGAEDLPASGVDFNEKETEARQKLTINPENLSKQQWSCYSRLLRAGEKVLKRMARNHPDFCTIRKKTV